MSEIAEPVSAPPPEVLDVAEATELLRIGRSALYDLCGRGGIPHRRVGKKIRFSRVALLRWLEGERSST